jgi:quercetin dioxygenase-like cupin family protein
MSEEATTIEPSDSLQKDPRRIWFFTGLATIHLSAEDTNNKFSLLETLAPAGDMPPLHVHRTDDEGFYLLEGSLTLWVGPERIDLQPGEFVLAPHGVPHTYRVQSDDGARWLVTSSDASFARFVAAAGVSATENRLPDPTEPDIDRLSKLAAEHGIDILGPPGALPS